MNHRQKSAITKFLFPVLTIAVVGAGIILNVSISRSDTNTLTRAALQDEMKVNWGFAGDLEGWRLENAELMPRQKPQAAVVLLKPESKTGRIVSHKLNHALSKGIPHITLNYNLKASREGVYVSPEILSNTKVAARISYLTSKSNTWDDAKAITADIAYTDADSQVTINLGESDYFQTLPTNDVLTFIRLEPVATGSQPAGDTIEFSLDNLNLSFR